MDPAGYASLLLFKRSRRLTDEAPGGEAVDASCGPIGALRTVWTADGPALLAHSLTTLADLAPTPNRCHNSKVGAHIDPASREIRRRNNPTETLADLTSQSGKQQHAANGRVRQRSRDFK